MACVGGVGECSRHRPSLPKYIFVAAYRKSQMSEYRRTRPPKSAHNRKSCRRYLSTETAFTSPRKTISGCVGWTVTTIPLLPNAKFVAVRAVQVAPPSSVSEECRRFCGVKELFLLDRRIQSRCARRRHRQHDYFRHWRGAVNKTGPAGPVHGIPGQASVGGLIDTCIRCAEKNR